MTIGLRPSGKCTRCHSNKLRLQQEMVKLEFEKVKLKKEEELLKQEILKTKRLLKEN